MGRRKFEPGMRVQVTYGQAPARVKGRVRTIRDYRTYEGYGIEFDDDKPGSIERLHSTWIELLTLNGSQPRTLVFTHPQDNEKRRSKRYQADCSVAIEFQGHRIIGRCVDYSERGFGAILEYNLPIGWIVSIEIPITGRDPLRLQARVVHEKDSRYGFEFVFPESSQRTLIADFFRDILAGAG